MSKHLVHQFLCSVVWLALFTLTISAQAPAIADKQTEVFGQKIFYLEAGTGPTVILLHGLGGDVSNWALTVPAIEIAFAAKLKRGDGFTISQFTEMVLRSDDFLDGKTKLIKAPTLVVWGREDGLTPLAIGDAYAQDIAGAEKAILDKCGHVPQLECTAAFNAVLLKFLGAPTAGK